jgi:hypothetical protein
VVERQHDGAVHAIAQAEELFAGDAHRRGELGGIGLCALGGKVALGLGEAAALGAHGPGRPVGRAD